MERIGVLKKLLLSFKILLKEDEEAKEIEFLSKLISVGIYLDKHLTDLELEYSKTILDKELQEDAILAWESILVLIERYKDESSRWEFAKNKNEVVDKIIKTNKYLYAKFLIDILESDEIAEEELEIYEKLKPIVEMHERLLIRKKLK